MSALRCCIPWFAPDHAWRHARDCPGASLTKLTYEERRALRASRYLEHVIDLEGPGAVAPAIGRMAAWYRHRPDCTCEDCTYVDGHLDDGT